MPIVSTPLVKSSRMQRWPKQGGAKDAAREPQQYQMHSPQDPQTHMAHTYTRHPFSHRVLLVWDYKRYPSRKRVSASLSSNTTQREAWRLGISTYLRSSSKLKGTYPSWETRRDCCRCEWCHIHISRWLYCIQRQGSRCRVQNQAAGHRPSSRL